MKPSNWKTSKSVVRTAQRGQRFDLLNKCLANQHTAKCKSKGERSYQNNRT